MYVLDASVVVKWFVEEEDTDKALLLKEGHIKGEFIIIVPDILIYEVANVLKYSAAFSEDEVHEAIQDLYDLGLDIIAPIPKIVHSAIKLSYDKDITQYDSSYIALAQELALDFITADEKLHRKMKGLPFVQLLRDLS
jgi:predicted nucleic acid-binding protein